ncbi:hypothetical protein HK096_008289 [Nowakowskiella sp. JEL0078]|nr:hypothetical protein HK096_008289 [Nowakowskiella sp. JEL0078]
MLVTSSYSENTISSLSKDEITKEYTDLPSLGLDNYSTQTEEFDTLSIIDQDINSLTPEELRHRLQECLAALREKEKSLELAAQFGQQLIESNNFLSAEYENLSKRVKRLTPALMVVSKLAGSVDSIRIAEQYLDDSDVTWVQSSDHQIQLEAESSLNIQKNQSALITKENMYDKITYLEQMNTDLRENLELTMANFRESEERNNETVVALRKSNNKLSEQLRTTLSDLRDAEQSHCRSVANLEEDLDTLRKELTETTQFALDLDAEKRRLLREKHHQEKENKSTEISDQQEIRKLNERIQKMENENKKLTREKRDAERKRDAVREEVQKVTTRLSELEQEAKQSQNLTRVIDEQQQLIFEMREHMEETVHLYDAAVNELAFRGLPFPTRNTNYKVTRTIASNPDEMQMIVRQQQTIDPETGEWHLGKWVERSGQRMWEFDLHGLIQEIDDLRQHRAEAFVRVRRTVDDLLTSVVDRLPPGLIKGITTKVLEPIRLTESEPELTIPRITN